MTVFLSQAMPKPIPLRCPTVHARMVLALAHCYLQRISQALPKLMPPSMITTAATATTITTITNTIITTTTTTTTTPTMPTTTTTTTTTVTTAIIRTHHCLRAPAGLRPQSCLARVGLLRVWSCLRWRCSLHARPGLALHAQRADSHQTARIARVTAGQVNSGRDLSVYGMLSHLATKAYL